MDVILTKEGEGEIAKALASDKKLNITKYRFGLATNVPLNDGFITDVVDFFAEGESGIPFEGVIIPNFISPNNVRFILRLGALVGPYNPGVGNVMLFTDTGIPFLFGSLKRNVPKEVTTGGENVLGSEMEFIFTVKITNVGFAVAVPIVQEECASLPMVNTQFDLDWPPGTGMYNVHLVDNHTNTCAPFIGLRSLSRETNFGTPFTEDVRSTNFGTFDSGVGQDSFMTRTTMDFGTYMDRRIDSDRDPDDPLSMLAWLDFDGGEYTGALSPSPTWTEVWDFETYQFRRVPAPIQNDVPLSVFS